MKRIFLLIVLSVTGSLYAQLIPYRDGAKWGYCDTAMVIKIKPQFQLATFFWGNMAFVMKDSLYYGIDKETRILTPALKKFGTFSDGLCPVQLTNGKCLYIDEYGNTPLDMEFSAAENFSEGLAVVSVHKKLGIINTSGDFIRYPNFDTSSLYFKSGFLMGLSKGKYFYIDRHGRTMHLPDSIQPMGIFSEGLAAVFVKKKVIMDGKWTDASVLAFMDTSGKLVLNDFVIDSFDYAAYMAPEKEFRDGKAIVKSRNEIGWDYYFIDKKGRFSPLYSVARHLGDSFFLGIIGYYMSDVRILDTNLYVAGQFQHKPIQLGEFGNGLLPFKNKDGLWGYVNSNCREVVTPKYSNAFSFHNGYAFIVLNGLMGVIDTRGREYFR